MGNIALDIPLEELEANVQKLVDESVVENATEELPKEEIATEGVLLEEKATSPLSAIEVMASNHGWNPKGEKGAAEFVEYAMTNLATRGKDVKDLKRSVDALLDLNSKQNEAGRKEGYETALAELKAAKIEAIQQGDVEQVDSIDKEIMSTTEEYSPVDETKPPQALVDFNTTHNKWLKEDTSAQAFKMQEFIKRRDTLLAERRLPVEKHMAILDEHIREEFPDYFNDTQAVAEDVKMYPTVDSGANSGVAGKVEKKMKWSELPEQYKAISRSLEKSGTMTKDAYVKQLIETGAL